MGVDAANKIADNAMEVLGMRLVVRKTFLEIDEPSPIARRGGRAKTEPCAIFDLLEEESDCAESSLGSTAHPESPVCRMDSFATQSSCSQLSPARLESHASDCESTFTVGNSEAYRTNYFFVMPSPITNGCMPYSLSDAWVPAAVCNQVENLQDGGSMPDQTMPLSSQIQQPQQTRMERTTLMLRNIPNDYSRNMLTELLDSQGFVARYNFVYLPVDFKRMAGLGYAFVNCCSQADAEEMMALFHGFGHWRFNSAKVCEVVWGEPLQGLQAHIDRYRNSPVMHGSVPEGCKPALFENGVRCAFPSPTKRIRAPRK